MTGQTVLGRFGWKATQPSLAAQTAAALSNDLGVAIEKGACPLSPAANRDKGYGPFFRTKAM